MTERRRPPRRGRSPRPSKRAGTEPGAEPNPYRDDADGDGGERTRSEADSETTGLDRAVTIESPERTERPPRDVDKTERVAPAASSENGTELRPRPDERRDAHHGHRLGRPRQGHPGGR